MRLMMRAEVPPRGRATLQASMRETLVSTAPPEIDDIRRKMAQIRRDLHQDVKSVVEGAEAATDWRRFIRNYPWASMGVALAVGYMIVPRRQKAPTLQVAPAELARAVGIEAPKAVELEKKKGNGLAQRLRSGCSRRWPSGPSRVMPCSSPSNGWLRRLPSR